MSWDATLICSHGYQADKDWNYTYNTTFMTIEAAKNIGIEWNGFQDTLNGMSALDGAELLAKICDELVRNSVKYDPMNPPNGWGDREGIVRVMRDMIDAGLSVVEDVYWRIT